VNRFFYRPGDETEATRLNYVFYSLGDETEATRPDFFASRVYEPSNQDMTAENEHMSGSASNRPVLDPAVKKREATWRLHL
jgi:hypothetical protein